MADPKLDRILTKIQDRLKGHDFCGEILDDAFEEEVVPRAIEYLTDEEVEELEAIGCTPGEAVKPVIEEFLQYLLKTLKDGG